MFFTFQEEKRVSIKDKMLAHSVACFAEHSRLSNASINDLFLSPTVNGHHT